MMQQFATSPSKIAVSTLKMDANAAESFSKDFNHSFDDARSAFEKAIADAEQSAFVKASDVNKESVFEERVSEQPVIREQRITDGLNASEQPDSDSIGTTNLSRHQDQSNQAQREPNIHSQDLVQEQNDSDTHTINEGKINIAAQEHQETLAILIDDQVDMQKQEFDYINFVAAVQSFHNDVDTGANDDTARLTEGLMEDKQSQDLMSISLNEQELQVILDAQQAGLDLKQALSDEQQVKLSEAIKNMLGQYHQNNQSTQTNTSISADKQAQDVLDVTLIETMITTMPSEGKQALAPSSLEQPIVDEKMPLIQKDNIATAQALKVEESVPTQNLLQQTLGNEDTSIEDISIEAKTVKSGSLPDQVALAKQANEMQEATLAKVNTEKTLAAAEVPSNELAAKALGDIEPAVNKISDVSAGKFSINNEAPARAELGSINKDADNGQSIAKQLAMLDERSQTNIIENIKSRVEKFAAELSGNSGKGSEFVAAMQAGLKEFKAQMQSGREPGIDIKALISDAMAQTNVDIPPQNQMKVDAALNQFSGLMNLASAVNHSTQAQAHQLFEPSDIQLIKESSALNTEGTKLAQVSPTAVDKALNVFKPEGQQQLAEKVRWMINGRNTAAEIRFDPPELGSMQIKINMSGETAAVSFTVQSAGAKEALDQALPKLRDILQEQGIELGQSSVQQESQGRSEQEPQQQHAANGSAQSNTNELLTQEEGGNQQVIEQRISGGSLSKIDYYA